MNVSTTPRLPEPEMVGWGSHAPDNLPDDRAWCCIQCKRNLFARSILDPDRCIHCAPLQRYVWRRCSFGRMRRASPLEAARWR